MDTRLTVSYCSSFIQEAYASKEKTGKKTATGRLGKKKYLQKGKKNFFPLLSDWSAA